MNRKNQSSQVSKPTATASRHQGEVATMRSDLFNDDFFGMNGMLERHMGQMGNFGGMMDQFFGGRQMNMRDPFSDILSGFDEMRMPSFEGPHMMKGKDGQGGHFVSQTFVYSQKMGADGKPKVEKYMNSNVGGITKEGRRVAEMEEMYKNTETGTKKVAHQKTLDGKGYKQVRTRHNGQDEDHHYFHGMEDHEGAAFEEEWHKESQNAKLSDLHKHLMNEKKMLESLQQKYGGKNIANQIKYDDSEPNTPLRHQPPLALKNSAHQSINQKMMEPTQSMAATTGSTQKKTYKSTH